jgi:hypothetical protein
MSRALGAATGIVLLALAGAAEAQQNPLIGTWSTTIYRGGGQAAAAVLASFDANGRCQERITVRAGTSTHWCQYRLSQDAGTLQLLFYDYAPKGTHIPPGHPLNRWLSYQLQWAGRDVFVLLDPGAAPLRYVRRQ